MFREPKKRRVGLKMLIVGGWGSGKTMLALTAPNIAALDSEAGMSLYEEQPIGKNLRLIANTQSYDELSEAFEEIMEIYEEENIQTVVIDSETKFFKNIQQAILTVEERKALGKGVDPLDSNLSIRNFGKINQISDKLQSIKIDASAAGIHVISVAQEKDIKKFDKVSKTYEVIGRKGNMANDAEYDYDIVLYMTPEEKPSGEVEYSCIVKKDRSGVFKKGDKIINPSFDMWESVVNGMEDGEVIKTKLTGDMKKSQDKYNKDAEKEAMDIKTRATKLLKDLKDKDVELAKEYTVALKEEKIGSLSKLTAAQQGALLSVIERFEAKL